MAATVRARHEVSGGKNGGKKWREIRFLVKNFISNHRMLAGNLFRCNQKQFEDKILLNTKYAT
jgi:hypothetical protein